MKLNFLNNKPRKKTIKLFWFRHKYPESMNFGDELAYETVKNLSGKEIEWASIEECEMVTVGSVLGPVLSRKSNNNINIWGTGLMFDGEQVKYNKNNNHIWAVRGKLTAKRLALEKVTIGDPALLADMFYKPSNNIKKIGIVPHYVDKNDLLINKFSKAPDTKIINVYDKPSTVASEIASCKLIISSSLHGIILAHSYGIPAFWIELSDKVAGEGFKFHDYYSAINKSPQKLSRSQLNTLLKEADKLIDSYDYPDLDQIKSNLLKSFPY